MRIFIFLFFLFFPYFFYSFASNFLLEKLAFNSDINFEKTEFLYLTDLREGSFISNNDLKKAKANLYKKGRFAKIEIEVSNLNKGKYVNFNLTANWVLKKLDLRGVQLGKHNYYSLYKQDPGDVFNVFLHEKNIEEMKEYLKDKGYFNCVVCDELIYNKKDKSIRVKILIKKKSRFRINSISFNVFFDKQDNSLNPNVFVNNLNDKIGTKYSGKKYSKNLLQGISRKIKKIFRKKDFVNSRILIKKKIFRKDNKLELFFSVYLGKKLSLKFKGNNLFSDEKIKTDLLGVDYPICFFTPEIIAHELFEEYYKRGYWNAVIFYKKIDKNNFLFDIKENSPVLIKDIIVVNEDGKQDFEVQDFLDVAIKNKVFNEELIDSQIDKIKKVNLERGFWNFDIVNKKFIKKKNNKTCKVILTIRKGKQRFWGGLDIKDFNNLKTNESFSPYVNSAKLNPFNFYLLQKQKLFLLKHFQEKGYWYVDAYPFLSETPIDKCRVEVFVTWKVELGPKIKFGKIFLKGDSSLSFKRILHELSFKEGQTWDKNKISLTIKNLKKLDIFKKVWIGPDQKSLTEKRGSIPMKVTLVEDDPFQATLRVGYFLTNKNFLFKRSSTFKVGGSLILKNPTNQVDKLSFNMDFTRFERKFDLDYKILSPLGLKFKQSRLIGKFRAYSNKYINPVQIKQSYSAYEAVESGFLFGLNNEFKKYYFWRFDFGNEWIRTSKVRGNLNFRQDYINKTLPYFFLNPSCIVEKIDNKLDIKKGSVSFLSLKFMIPEYSGNLTGKLMCEQSIFKPIYKDTLVAARVRLGYILKSNFETIQPSQRFYLGGPYSVRGYEKDAIPPYGINTTEGGEEYTIQGGSGMININLELRFPLYKALRGVFFQDIGALSQSGFAGFKGKWFPSSGFGIRYKTPIGPIRLDIGFKWKHLLPGDTSYAWYLTLGEVF